MEAAQDDGNQARNGYVGKAHESPGKVPEERPAQLRSLAEHNAMFHPML